MERDLFDRLSTDRKYLRATKRFNMAASPEEQIREYTAKCKRFYEIIDGNELTKTMKKSKQKEGSI